jgi:hypothetical protein
VSDQEPVTITLVGRTSAWLQRLPAGPADRGIHPPRPARGDRSLIASWVHHQRYGTLGVYLAVKSDTHGQALTRGQWVQITGQIRPYLAYALPDDPRSTVANEMTPLLIEATQIDLVHGSQQQIPPPMLTSPRQARVLRIPPGSPRQIAPLAHWADAVYWRRDHASPVISVAWNTVRGVVTQLGDTRYLRYVLSLRVASPAAAR